MSDLLLGKPLHHTQALELVCAAERCDMWAEIRADEDGMIRFYIGEATRTIGGWTFEGGATHDTIFGVAIGSLQMFGKELDWQTWGIRQSDWRWMFPDPHNERAFRGYMSMMESWASVVRAFPAGGEFVLVAGTYWNKVHNCFLGQTKTLQDGWADLLGVTADNWQTWQMEL